jgi:hypothetical protein
LIARVVGVVVFAVLAVTTGRATAAPPRTVPVGAPFAVAVPGFAPRTAVEVRLLGSTMVTTRRADRVGVLRTAYRAPSVAGRYRLVVSGRPAIAPAEPSSGLPRGLNVVTLVPLVAFVDFRAVHRARTGEGIGGVGSGPPGVANTGLDLTAQLRWCAVALTAGTALIVVGRRRRAAGR